jgi:hypothetical protein
MTPTQIRVLSHLSAETIHQSLPPGLSPVMNDGQSLSSIAIGVGVGGALVGAIAAISAVILALLIWHRRERLPVGGQAMPYEDNLGPEERNEFSDDEQAIFELEDEGIGDDLVSMSANSEWLREGIDGPHDPPTDFGGE